MEIFPADHAAVPDEKDLCRGSLLQLADADDIPVIHVRCGHLLTRSKGLDLLKKLSVFDGLLKLHGIGSCLHLLLQISAYIIIFSGEKLECPVNMPAVFFAADVSIAGAEALSEMIIEARALLPDILREPSAAAADAEELVQKVNAVPDCGPRGIGPEVFCMVLFYPAGHEDPGEILFCRHLDVRVGLVILQKGVVFGTVFLDQVVFKNQGLHFRIHHDILEPADQGDHSFDLLRLALC